MDLANPFLSYAAVFLAGIASSASPCVMIVFPLVIGYVGGYAEGDLKRSILFSFLFCLGIAVTFTALGAAASYLGILLGPSNQILKYFLALVAILMGLQLTGLINLPLPQAALPHLKTKGLTGAFLAGLLFGLVLTPCATPVLAVVLTYVATKQNFLYGASLLFTYAIGYTALAFLLGLSAGMAQKILSSSGVQKASAFMHKISGIILILFGLYLLFF